jgi:organic radical activating enzyme
MDVEALLDEVRAVVPADFRTPWVWITGGEPSDHDLSPLVVALHALATSGVRLLNVPIVDWVSVSPHTADFAQRVGHELKVVPGLNGLTWADIGAMRAHCFPWRYVQPLSGDKESQQACADFVMMNPGWQLTLQAHKSWNLP